jgi:hypothetical protein
MTAPIAAELLAEFRTSPRQPGPRAADRTATAVDTLTGGTVGWAALGPAVPAGSSPPAERADLLDTLRDRRSTRFFGADGIAASRLADIVVAGISADSRLWSADDGLGAFEVNVVAFRIDGLEPAIYRLDIGTRGYLPIAPLPAATDIFDLTLQREFCASAAILSLSANLQAVDAAHGAHGYRMAMSRAAAVAYRMWLEAVSGGLVGSVFAGFIPASVRQTLRSDGSGRHQLFALALGTAVEDTTPMPRPAPSRR